MEKMGGLSLEKLFTLAGKTAVVTGASSGLGVTFANVLAGAGARVVLAARRKEKLESVAQEIQKAGGQTLAVTCDVGDAQQVEAAAEEAWKKFGRVDIVVNNAGVAAEAGMMPENVPTEFYEQTVRVNLVGTWNCCRSFGSRMLGDGKGGSIINIASIAGLAGVRDLAPAYQATKGAVLNLTRNLACSWADRRVRVNAIAPGWFPSEMTDDFLRLPGAKRWVEEAAPMGRMGKPMELAGALVFLASDASSFVTGHTLVVDGGLAATMGGRPMPEEMYATLAKAVPGGRGRRIGV